jgi:hypothetical protein
MALRRTTLGVPRGGFRRPRDILLDRSRFPSIYAPAWSSARGRPSISLESISVLTRSAGEAWSSAASCAMSFALVFLNWILVLRRYSVPFQAVIMRRRVVPCRKPEQNAEHEGQNRQYFRGFHFGAS